MVEVRLLLREGGRGQVIIKTKIEFVWNTDDESEDRLEQTIEEWSDYYRNLMASDIEELVYRTNDIREAIQVEVERV